MREVEDTLFEPWSSTDRAPDERSVEPLARDHGPAEIPDPPAPTPHVRPPTRDVPAAPPRAPSPPRWARVERQPRARRAPYRDDPMTASAPLDTAVAALLRLADRLEMARHRAVVDDRTHETPPSVRFRIEPWRGPLDPAPTPAPVLELTPAESSGLVARTWADPRAEQPATVRPVAPSSSDGATLDEILLDFVKLSLSGPRSEPRP